MTATSTPDSTLVHRANLNIASAIMAKSGPRVPDSLIGRAIDEIRASHPVAELAESGNMPMVVSAVETFLARHHEADRPRNLYGAEAARAAQAAGAEGTRGGVGFGYIDAIRAGSSARYRELSGSDGKAGAGTSSTASSGNPVTPEFARSFAGTGMVGGTLRTFAAVGLDRDTFNAFHKEGFNRAQIIDSARDVEKLGWKGKEDLRIAQHALPEARKAVIAVEQAKTPEELAEAQAKEAEAVRKTEALPDDDSRKEGTKQFFKHAIKKSRNAERHKALGAGAQEHDAAVAKDHAGEKQSHAAQDGTMAKYGKQKTASVDASTDDAFGSSAPSPSAPAKPAPVRMAAAKPAAPAV